MANADDLITLTDAARIMRKSVMQVWRYITKGLHTPQGRIRLQHARIGRNVYTTREWIDTWCAEVRDAVLDHYDSIASTPPAKASRRVLDAETYCESAGIR